VLELPELEPVVQRPRKRRRLGGVLLGVVSIAIVGSLVAVGVTSISGLLSEVAERLTDEQYEDYSGPTGPEVEIVIQPGDGGEQVAQKMVDADIVASFEAIIRPMRLSNPVIYPGTYLFPTKMSGAAALALLVSGENRVVLEITLREGLRLDQMLSRLSEQLDIPLAELEAAVEQIDLPEGAPNAEAMLFPATYRFDPGVSAERVVNTLHNRLIQELDSFGLSLAEDYDVLIIASLIQAEASIEEDFYKVSRVIQNRLDDDMLLQFDSTVNYGTKGTTVTTSDEQRADDNPYNTYRYKGLPIGAIGAPGSLAINAALNPVEGDWIYFVTVNLKTGETVFNRDYADHLIAVKDFLSFLRENPEFND
jgi:UPF0755 protein